MSNSLANETDCYAGGFMFLRWFARHAALQTISSPAPGDVTATVDLSKGNTGNYIVSGLSKTETAQLNGSGTVTLGSANNKTYTVNSATSAKQSIKSNGGWIIEGVKTNVSVKAGGSGYYQRRCRHLSY